LSGGRGGLVALAAAALAACSIEARSTNFECTSQADCPDGRVCQSSWCVLPGSSGRDGGGPIGDAGGDGDDGSADASVAPCSEAVCDRCEADGTCTFLCTQANACQEGVECPPGMPCQVLCIGTGSCLGGVDCSSATDCTVQCGKNDACAGPITCGGGRCDVACTARGTCASGVDCSDSCACTTDCSGQGACALSPDCPFEECVAGDGDCTNGIGCDVCP
jgi:hypothetical protein